MDNKAGMVTEACILEVEHEGQRELQRFYITDLGFDRALLGYPWLSTFEPKINWKQGTIHGRTKLSTVPNAWEKWRDLRRKELVARIQIPMMEDLIEEKESDWEIVARTNFAQEWARETVEAKQEWSKTEVPREYQRHAVVFDEEAAKQFPPSRPEDHAIRLKEGAPSEINCKVYPLTKQELVATKEFIDKNLELGYIERCDPSKPEGAPWSTPDGTLVIGETERPQGRYSILGCRTVGVIASLL
jgi:hypothetical protein